VSLPRPHRWQTACLARANDEGLRLTDSTPELAAEISRYCANHPGARDTLEGIAWWLAMQRCGDTLDQLRAAVDLLIERKLLVRYHLNDGTAVYGCPADNVPKGSE